MSEELASKINKSVLRTRDKPAGLSLEEIADIEINKNLIQIIMKEFLVKVSEELALTITAYVPCSRD